MHWGGGGVGRERTRTMGEGRLQWGMEEQMVEVVSVRDAAGESCTCE